MNQLSSKDRLKDKFSKLEMDVDDERFVHKLTEVSISKIKPVGLTKSRQNLFMSSLKLMKYGSFSCVKHVKKLGIFSFNKIASSFFNILSKTLTFAREKEERAELFLEKKVNRIELVRKEIKDYEVLKRQNLEKIIDGFRQGVAELFQNKLDSDEFTIQYSSEDNVNAALEDQMTLMDIISKKIVFNRMILNVKKIKCKIAFDGDELASKMTFELDKKGHLWATMFGKSIIPDLYKIIGNREGKITIKQSYNTTTSKDLFYMTMSYKLREESKKSIFSTPIQDEMRDQAL